MGGWWAAFFVQYVIQFTEFDPNDARGQFAPRPSRHSLCLMPISRRVQRVLRFAVLGAVFLGVAIQFVPVKGVGTNPPERISLGAPPDVEAVMRRACLDCHSNETRWPLYARIAPASWLMARDVNRGRQHLNLSEWAGSDEEERKLDRENCWEKIEAGEMPPWFYVYPMHLGAKLSEADKALLKSWMLKDSDQGLNSAGEHAAVAPGATPAEKKQ